MSDKALISVSELDPGLISMGTYEGELGEYELFGIDSGDGFALPLVETPFFKLAVVRHPGGQLGLAKVNRIEEVRDKLEREARVLRTLQQIARKIDLDAAVKGELLPNHGAFFPTVTEVIDDEKLVLLLGYHMSINTYKQLIPLSVVTNEQRIDLKSATWILGKILKTLGFVHAIGFTVGNLNASTVLLERDAHGIVLFDFSQASEDPAEAEKLGEVTETARIIWEACGGSDESPPPHDEALMSKEHYTEYLEVLNRIMRGETEGASAEHELIYKLDEGLADRIWPRREKTEGGLTVLKRDFHEFTVYPR